MSFPTINHPEWTSHRILSFLVASLFIFVLGCDPTLNGNSGLGLKQELELSLQDSTAAGLILNEGDSPQLVFIITGTAEEDITINWELTQIDGGGIDNDFSFLKGQAIIPKLKSSLNIDLSLIDDVVFEGVETYKLKLSQEKQILSIPENELILTKF